MKTGHQPPELLYEEDEIDLYELWLVLVRRKKVVLGITFFAVLIALIIAFLLPPVYKTEATLMPLGGKGKSLGGLAGLASLAGISLPVEQSGITVEAVLKSRTLRERIIKRLNLLPKLFSNKWDKKHKKWILKDEKDQPPSLYDGAEALKGLISVSTDRKTGVIIFSVEFKKDPKIAYKIAVTGLQEARKILNEKAFTLARKYRIYVEERLKEAKKVLKKSDGNNWLKHVNEVKDYWRENLKLHPGEMSAAKILRKLREVLPKESIVTTEVGQHQMWASLFFDAIHPGTFFSSTGLGTMGWGFPAAIGAKVARPDVAVVDIAGDGSFNMTENSLATSVLEDIPVIVFLINNFSLGMVAQWQRTFYDRRMIGIDLKKCPDYVKLAESYGAQGIRAQSLDELGKAVKVGLNSDVTTVIDIPIDPEEDVLPFVAPGTSLKDMILPS